MLISVCRGKRLQLGILGRAASRNQKTAASAREAPSAGFGLKRLLWNRESDHRGDVAVAVNLQKMATGTLNFYKEEVDWFGNTYAEAALKFGTQETPHLAAFPIPPSVL